MEVKVVRVSEEVVDTKTLIDKLRKEGAVGCVGRAGTQVVVDKTLLVTAADVIDTLVKKVAKKVEDKDESRS